MRPGGSLFRSLRRPVNRPPQATGRPDEQHPLRVQVILAAEAAADIGGNQVKIVDRLAEHVGKLAANGMEPLGGQGQERPARLRIVFRDACAGLQRRRHHPLVHQIERRDVRCLSDRGRHCRPVAPLKPEREIPGYPVPQLGRSRRKRLGPVRDDRERLVVDLHRFGRVERLPIRFRHDERHRFTDVAHSVAGQRRALRNQKRLHGVKRRDTGNRPQIQTALHQHGQHSGLGPGGPCINRADHGMRMGRTQHHGFGR